MMLLLLLFVSPTCGQFLLQSGQPVSKLTMHTNRLRLHQSNIRLNQDVIETMSNGLGELGNACQHNVTCSGIGNSMCLQGTCKCLPNFYQEETSCKLAPGFNEACVEGAVQCRTPFACNSTSMCDCPPGYIQEYFQCVRNCATGHIPLLDKCIEGRTLDDSCDVSEQCMQSYSHCLHGKCQCIPGASRLQNDCSPVSQCPLGEPAINGDGNLSLCKAEAGELCPDGYYCLYAEFNNQHGFCCPRIKMNCPIGKPLEGVNCSSCPWETHHCFSYVIGTYTESMCCPNACPASQPIQLEGICYHRVAFGGNCMVDDQCFNVLGAICRSPVDDDSSKSKCLCPRGNYNNYFGKCVKDSTLGEGCTSNEECKTGSNTICMNGVCSCFQGYMPEPTEDGVSSATKCIAEPSCPTANGVRSVGGAYEDCHNDDNMCSDGFFCRKWWFDGHKTYSLCCPKPNMTDLHSICKPFRMTLVIGPEDLEPTRCDIAPFPVQLLHDDARQPQLRYCPQGSSCLFDPFSVNQGVCCRPEQSEFKIKNIENRRLHSPPNYLRYSPRKQGRQQSSIYIPRKASPAKFNHS